MSGSQEYPMSDVVPTAKVIISTDTKKCSKCEMAKPLSEFHKNNKGMFGRHSVCGMCRVRINGVRRKEHPESAQAWRGRNKDKINENSRKKYRDEHPIKPKLGDNAAHIKELHNKYRLRRGKEFFRELSRLYRIVNPEKVKEIKKRHYKKHERTDNEKLRDCIRGGVNKTLIRGGKGGRKWQDLVGYTIVQLKKHLEKQFEPGMTWGNRGTEWHIDHIVPVAAFNFETPDDIDFKRCWALTNLRPLWAPDNIKKRDKLEKPFQTSLLVAA